MTTGKTIVLTRRTFVDKVMSLLFNMYKLGLEKAEESEIKLPTSVGSQRKQVNSRKIFTFVSMTTWKPLTVLMTTNHGKFLKEMGISDHLTLLMINLYVDEEATVRTLHGTVNWSIMGKGEWQGYILSFCLFNFYAEYIMKSLDESHQSGWMPSWNQDCWDKYQQLQICR